MREFLKVKIITPLVLWLALAVTYQPVQSENLKTTSILNSPPPVAYILDPVSGEVKGIIDPNTRVLDSTGNLIVGNAFSGYLAIDPVTHMVKGTIDPKGNFVVLNVNTFPNTSILADSAGYIVDPVSGALRGYIDASGRFFDVTGNLLSPLAEVGFVVIDPKTSMLKGVVKSTAEIASTNIAVPDVLRQTTTIVKGGPEGSTTITTTTTTAAAPVKVVLPSTGVFIAIDPITGTVRGTIDPVTLRIDGQSLPSGFMVVDKTTGALIGMTDISGNIVDISSYPINSAFLSSIEDKRAQMNRIVSEQLAAGNLSDAQAAELRSALNKIAAAETQAVASGGVVTYAEALPLAIELRSLGNRVVTITSALPLQPIIASHIVIVGNRIMFLDEIGLRRFELQRRINDEYAADRLTTAQAAELNTQMDEIAALEATLRVNGGFSYKDSKLLFARFDRVGSQLDRFIAHAKRTTLGAR